MELFLNLTNKDFNAISHLEEGTTNQKRYAEVLKLMIIDKDFQNLVAEIRKELKIPANGFSIKDKKEYAKFLKFTRGIILSSDVLLPQSIDFGETIENKIRSFLNGKSWYGSRNHFYNTELHKLKLHIPVKEYIALGYFYLEGCELVLISVPEYGEKGDKNTTEIRLEMSLFVSKAELLEYIKRNWQGIEFIKENVLKNYSKKRIKAWKTFNRDIQIYRKYQELKREKLKYPDLKIAKLLKKLGIHLSEGTIRSIISRVNKFVANKES